LSLKKLVYLDGQKAVLYRSRMNPSLGRNFEAMDASRVRASRRETEASDAPAEPTTKRRCAPSWARLISKVYHADPLLCRQCGGKLKVVPFRLHPLVGQFAGLRDDGDLGFPSSPGPCQYAPRLASLPIALRARVRNVGPSCHHAGWRAASSHLSVNAIGRKGQ